MPSFSEPFALITPRSAIRVLVWLGAGLLIFHLYRRDAYQSAKTWYQPTGSGHAPLTPPPIPVDDGLFHWQNLPVHYPVKSLIPLPSGAAKPIPRIQHAASQEDAQTKTIRLERLAAVKDAFQHAWVGYRNNAWMADEVGPLSGARHNYFGGWAASLVDALDTLWIMGMKEQFEDAVEAIGELDFTTTEETTLNVFETTIRYMGGLLSAYDLSDAKYPALLAKAVELGEMLLVAFDTPNRMPITRWDWKKARDGELQEADSNVLVAELGSMTLELTRLSQITGDGRFYDAVQRIMNEFDKQQMKTKLPGMWPITVNARDLDFTSDTSYILGAMADSVYEYLPKQHMLLGGRTEQYRNLYLNAATTFKEHNFYRPMTIDNADILFSALVQKAGDGHPATLDNSMQHLVCFAGGMVSIGAKIFSRPKDLAIARKLVDGCIWAYQSMPNGIMAEVTHHVACENSQSCEWNETRWYAELMRRESDYSNGVSGAAYEERVRARIRDRRLPPGYVAIDDTRYILRPEAIESLFIWYRISGDRTYQDKAWAMFQSIDKYTRTSIAHAALDDVTADPPTQADRMESFWMAETLKYFYLTFAEPELVSLDEFVFNTEAHPFRRPGR